MHMKTAILRAARAMREDLRLHLVSISSLTVAFLCLATALWAMQNLGAVADAWGRSARMSIYLRDGASSEDVERLRLVLESVGEVRAVEHVSAERAREEFAQDAELDAALAGLPADAFPASLEVELAAEASRERVREIANRVRAIGAVEDVESYEGWFGSLDTLISTGRAAASALAILVLLCVLFVVANTIRLAIAGRRDEIEVLKLCGASDGFVRGPFLVEGAVQGFVSALCAVLLLFVLFSLVRSDLDGTLAALAGVRTVFLGAAWAAAMIAGGAMLGAAGSAIALRRYLAV